MKKLLVIGANGKIGTELVKTASDKYKVTAAIRDRDKAERFNNDNVSLTEFEFDNKETWDNVLNKSDYAFILAPSGLEKPYDTVSPFLYELLKTNIDHIVLSTAMGIERSDRTPLRQLELDLMNSGKNYTILRPNWFMQNFFTSLKSKIIEEGKLILPAGDSQVSFIDTRDIAQAALNSFGNEKHVNKSYTLTGCESLTHYQVAEYLTQAVGKEIKYIPVMLIEYRKMLIESGFPEYVADHIINIFDMMSKGYSKPISYDYKTILGREPIKFKQFAIDYSNFWK